MADLLNEYRRERKRARDRLYRARKKYGVSIYAKDLPEIPVEITQEDIADLIDISKGVLEAQETAEELEEFEEEQLSQDFDEMFAPDDEVASVSYFDMVIQKINDLEYRLRRSNFLGSKKGYAMSGKTAILVDTDSDKDDIIENWKNILDQATNTEAGARDLYNHLVENEEQIAEILNDMETVTYMLDQYNLNIYALETLLNYNSPNFGVYNLPSYYDTYDEEYEE